MKGATAALWVAMGGFGFIATVEADEVKSVRVVLPADGDPIMRNVGSVFARQVESRCCARVVMQGDAALTLALAIEPGVGTEGFRIVDGNAGTIRIVGNDARGVVYGVGKFLRTSGYSEGGFTPGTWRGESVPAKPIRGMYFATHFHNFYMDGPVEDITHLRFARASPAALNIDYAPSPNS